MTLQEAAEEILRILPGSEGCIHCYSHPCRARRYEFYIECGPVGFWLWSESIDDLMGQIRSYVSEETDDS